MRASILFGIAVLWAAGSAAGEPRCPSEHPKVIRPHSGKHHAADSGKRAHTNVEIFVPPGQVPKPPPSSLYNGNHTVVPDKQGEPSKPCR